MSSAYGILVTDVPEDLRSNLLVMVRNGLMSSQLASSGISPTLATQLLDIATVALGCSTKDMTFSAAYASSVPASRRLLSVGDFNTAITPNSEPGRQEVLSIMDSASAELAKKLLLNGQPEAAGNAGIYVTETKQTACNFAAYTLPLQAGVEGSSVSFASGFKDPEALEGSPCFDSITTFVAQVVDLPNALISIAPTPWSVVDVAAYQRFGDYNIPPPLAELELMTAAGEDKAAAQNISLIVYFDCTAW